jgi:putative sigma-54 modulation protein
MNVKINAVHFKTDKKLQTFIKEKLMKLNTYYEGVIGAEVMLKLDNNEGRDNKIMEVRVIIKGNDLFAVKESKTFEEATDLVTEALKKQLLKYKDKVRRK